MNKKIFSVLEQLGIDAYVGYDFRGSNYIIRNVLGFQNPTTRRWVAVITNKGEFHLVIPKLEESIFADVSATKHIYITYQQFQDEIKNLVGGAKTIAVDYFSNNDIPVLDITPAGFYQLLTQVNPSAAIISSAVVAQKVASTWDAAQYESHLLAGKALKDIADQAWELIKQSLADKKPITDLDIENFIVGQYTKHKLITQDNLCIVSTNQHASNPHYWPTEEHLYPINPNSVLLFDIWARTQEESSIYADVTFMGWIGPDPVPAKVQEVWEVVRDARDIGVNFVIDNFLNGIKGFEVDRKVRNYIERKGYGDYFVHRTGHSIDTNDHGSGTNIDDFETKDTREIIPSTGFSIEPGIYLPEFGVRSELDMFVSSDGKPAVTTWQQKDLVII